MVLQTKNILSAIMFRSLMKEHMTKCIMTAVNMAQPFLYTSVLSKLIAATQENRINWHKTSRQNEYTTDITNYSVSIISLTQSTFSIIKSNSDKYALTLINEEGDVIDIFEVLISDNEYEKTSKLYLEARRSHYKVEEVLSSLIDSL